MYRRFVTTLVLSIIFGAVCCASVYAVGTGDGNLLRRTNQGDDTCGGPTNACHNLQVHNATNTGSTYWSSNWGLTTTGKYGKFICQTCHTPHNTQNIFLIKEKITSPKAGDQFPGEAGSTQGTVEFRYKSSVDTNSVPVYSNASYVMGNDETTATGRPSTSTRVCEVCHSQTLHHRYDTSAQTDGKSHNNAKDCTNSSCHTHEYGFKKPVGGTEGGGACYLCHPFQWNAMNGSDTSKYYMYLTSTDHLTYPNQSIFGSGDTTSANRKCTMCHARMEEFSPKVDFNNTVGNRAKNLRRSINITPDGSPITVSDTDFIAADASGDGGICTSCHKNSQYKANTATVAGGAAQTNADSTTYTPLILPALFANSPHNYEVPSATFSDNNSFKANCLKCHNEYPSSGADSKMTGSGNKFGPHASTIRRLNAPMTLTLDYGTATSVTASTLTDTKKTWATNQWKGRPVTIVSATTGKGQTRIISTNNTAGQITLSSNWTTTPTGTTINYSIGDPAEEEFCFNCHSTTRNPNYASKKDYYGVKTVQNGKMFKMEDMFKTYTGSSGTGNNADTACSGNQSSLTDTTAAWTANAWQSYSVRITSGTGNGQVRTIQSNTATKLCLEFDWYGTQIPSSSGYEIGQTRHKIEAYAGVHRADEAVNAPTNATTTGWFTTFSGGTHSGCADCHNPHAQKKSGDDSGTATSGTTTTITDTNKTSWTQDQWRGYNLRLMDGTGAGQDRMIVSNTTTGTIYVGAAFSTSPVSGTYYAIVPTGRLDKGNSLAGPNNGQWGVDVNPTDYTTPTNRNSYSNPVFTKNTNLVSGSDKIYELCFKCHSDYGWGTSGTPFDITDGTSTAYNTTSKGVYPMYSYTNGVSTNIAKEFNPKNLAYHPVVDIGANQPITAMGDTAQNILGPLTATGGSLGSSGAGGTITYANGWTANTYAGRCVEITGGTGAGQIRSISAHTASTITVDPSFATAPANLSQFYIRECSIYHNGTNYAADGNAVVYAWPRFTLGTLSLSSGSATATITGLSSGIPSTVIPGWYIYAGTLNTATEEPVTQANILNGCSGTAPCPPMFATTGWFQINTISPGASNSGTTTVTLTLNKAAGSTRSTQYAITAGLGNNFIPPYGPWSVIACTDCHGTDNPSDPSGPHGSANKWILRGLEAQSFPWYYGGTGAAEGACATTTTNTGCVKTIAYPAGGSSSWETVGALPTSGTANTPTPMPNYFCLNCHRADVYGFEDSTPTTRTTSIPIATGFTDFNFRAMSRMPHSPTANSNNDSSDGNTDERNTYGIMCMYCHGGDARSDIARPINEAMGGIHGTNNGNGGNSTTSYTGRRLLNGAAWRSVSRATTYANITCWTKDAADNISTCTQHGANPGDGIKANYPYYSGEDPPL